MVLVQNWPFFRLFFFRQYRPGRCVYDILEGKGAFLGYENKKFKKSKNLSFFQRGLVHGFGPKLAIFPSFYVRQYRSGKSVLRYSRRKNAFQGYKNKKFKKAKN